MAKAHLAEEIADVEICSEQVEYLLGLSLLVGKARHEKLQREIERIDKRENIELCGSEIEVER